MRSDSSKFWVVLILTFAALFIYLFVTAPLPLHGKKTAQYVMSARNALDLLAHENNVTRAFFTHSIVGQGRTHGLKFSENWRQKEVVAGPLPALFLRGVAESIAQSESPVELYLGSDFPIEASNRFVGKQAREFAAMRQDGNARYFRDPESNALLAMYPDYAVAEGCVSCHNEHASTLKSDWVLGDMMGATTWLYPNDSLTMDEFVTALAAYRNGVEDVWLEYLTKFEALETIARPKIGENWPVSGMELPGVNAFQDSLNTLASPHLLNALMKFSALE